MRSSPGAKAQTLGDACRPWTSRTPMPAMVSDEAGHDQGPLGRPLGEPLGGEGATQQADRGRGEDDAGLDRVVAAHDLQVGRDHERHAHEQQPLGVLGDQPEVGGAVAEQAGRQQRLLAGALLGAHGHGRTSARTSAPATIRPSISQRLLSAARMPVTTRTRPTADRTAPPVSNGRVGSAGSGSSTCGLSTDDHHDDQGLEDEGRPPADRRGDQAADQRAGRGADAAHRADHAERPGPRGDLGEQQRGEDVDRRDQQRRADALEDRVAEDEHAQAGRDRAHQRADAVDDQADA